MQPLGKKDKERELKKKNAELQSKVENLEKKCAVFEVFERLNLDLHLWAMSGNISLCYCGIQCILVLDQCFLNTLYIF